MSNSSNESRIVNGTAAILDDELLFIYIINTMKEYDEIKSNYFAQRYFSNQSVNLNYSQYRSLIFKTYVFSITPQIAYMPEKLKYFLNSTCLLF